MVRQKHGTFPYSNIKLSKVTLFKIGAVLKTVLGQEVVQETWHYDVNFDVITLYGTNRFYVQLTLN